MYDQLKPAREFFGRIPGSFLPVPAVAIVCALVASIILRISLAMTNSGTALALPGIIVGVLAITVAFAGPYFLLPANANSGPRPIIAALLSAFILFDVIFGY
ncbi:hypothetical protein NFC81_09020 [Salinispirillum sp. LH 10-3-1]|uniref:Uncharacterized protein n=1 Tax=Salinispirillum sp. LH 10-3-1 TaxID=2952525 RepID=A0AB38YBY7_9GAMM